MTVEIQKVWTAVDDYFSGLLTHSDPVLEAALAASDAAKIPPMNVAPNQGKLLYLIARMAGARNILEIGTLAGYSTIWLARALPVGGRLITLEADDHYARVARMNIDNAGFAHMVEIRVGRAIDSLQAIAHEKRGPFDLIFIDADKPSNPAYLEWSIRLARTGTVIIADNVVRNGMVLDGQGGDEKVQGIRRFTELMAINPRIDATAIQTVGSKGYDGFAIAIVGA